MSLVKAVKAWQSLTPEQKHIVNKRTVSGHHTPEEWLKLFKGLALFDTYRDEGMSTFRYFYFGSIGLGIFLAFIHPAMILLGLVFLFVSIAFHSTMSGRDLPNVLRQFVVPLVAVLKEEMKEGEKLSLTIDLSKKKLNRAKLLKTIPPLTEKLPRVKKWEYGYLLMKARGRLADGVILDWTIGDTITKKRTEKISVSGKYKTKVKYKTKSQFLVQLSFVKTKYQVPNLPKDSAHARYGLKPGGKRDTIRLKYQQNAAQQDYVPRFNHFFGLVSQLYKCLEPVK